MVNVAATSFLMIKTIQDTQKRHRENVAKRRKEKNEAEQERLRSIRQSAKNSSDSDMGHGVLSEEERAELAETKKMDIDQLINRATDSDLSEVLSRVDRGQATLTPTQLDTLSTIDSSFAESVISRSVSGGAVLSEKLKSKFCKSDSTACHRVLRTAKALHDRANPHVPFLTDTQLFDLSVSNDTSATRLVFESLAEDPGARHNHEPRENPNSAIVVHSKTVEMRPGAESTVFAACIESDSGRLSYLASRDPTELVLGIDTVLRNGRGFKHDPNTKQGIANTPFEAGLFKQLKAAQGLGLA